MQHKFTTLPLAAAALMGSTALASAEGQLNIYNWGNYTSPEMIEKFEEETGIDVTMTDYDSNDTALAQIRQGGHGYDIVVPSGSYLPIWIDEGLVQPLDRDIVTDLDNIEEQWRDVEFDPDREHSIPWAWGTTGVIVNTADYDGDINTSAIFLDPPEELHGRVNVIPEMSDVMHLAVRYHGGEPCTGDTDILREVRDTLTEAREHWIAMDYGTVDSYAEGDIGAGVYWNGASMRARLQNDEIAYGYPQEGFPIWMDNAMVLSDAQNVDEAMQFINFMLQPENAGENSNFHRYASGIVGADEYMDPEMVDAPEINIPEDLADAGRFSITCPGEVNEIYTQIWTELMQ